MSKWTEVSVNPLSGAGTHHVINTMNRAVCDPSFKFVLSNKSFNLTGIIPSDHEEAGTHIMLHLHHAVMNGQKNAFLWMVDSDGIVLPSLFNIT